MFTIASNKTKRNVPAGYLAEIRHCRMSSGSSRRLQRNELETGLVWLGPGCGWHTSSATIGMLNAILDKFGLYSTRLDFHILSQ